VAMSFAAILFPFLIIFFLVFLLWVFFAMRRRRKRKKLEKAEKEALTRAAHDGHTVEFRR